MDENYLAIPAQMVVSLWEESHSTQDKGPEDQMTCTVAWWKQDWVETAQRAIQEIQLYCPTTSWPGLCPLSISSSMLVLQAARPPKLQRRVPEATPSSD